MTFMPTKFGANPFARRREALRRIGGTLLAAAAVPLRAQSAGDTLRIGTTAVILDDQVGFLNTWRDYLERRLGARVRFVQRASYREITEALHADELDFAWVCGYPYAANKQFMRLLAMPLYRGRPLYQSYLIVPSTDDATRSFADLAGRIFAYSDPNSNSGFLVPQYEMLQAGLDPTTLFRRAFFTYAHRKVVVAIANGVANGGAVDGYVWETLALRSPGLTARTRVALKSAEYGFPPLVARHTLDDRRYEAMLAVLVGMSDDPQGRELLKALNLDGFAPPDDRVFDSIVRVLGYVSLRERLPA
jgi:phosphonate transport system substrate-binding protein